MARSDSGRIVIEVEPDLKADLYVELARRRTTLKAWFSEQAKKLIDEQGTHLIAAEPSPANYESGAVRHRRERE